MQPAFEFVETDREAAAAALRLLRRLLANEELTPAQILGLARAMYAIQRLPHSTDGVEVDFCASMTRGDDEYKDEWGWQVRITPEAFSISSGGSVWSRQSGGDSVSGYMYEVEAGGYRDNNGPVSSWCEDIDSRLQLPFQVIVNDDSTLTALGD